MISDKDELLTYMGENLIVQYEHHSNAGTGGRFRSRVHFRNGGSSIIPGGSGWEVHLNSIFPLETEPELVTDGR